MNSTDLKPHGISNWLPFSHLAERQLLTALPTCPGVYVIRLPQPEPRLQGASDIAYIGRAGNRNGLRGRVRQYFHPGPMQTTNIVMRQRICAPGCALQLGFAVTDTVATARRLESDLLLQFEKEHGELPPYNRQRALDLMSRLGSDANAG
jgi:excinuclease UvrABC nuclease subunit